LLKKIIFYKHSYTLVDGFYRTSCVETTVVYLSMNLILMPAAFITVYSSPWKLKIFSNVVLAVWLLIHFIYDIVVTIQMDAALGFLKLKEVPQYFRRDCFFIVIAFCVILGIFEDCLIKKLYFKFLMRRRERAIYAD
jgi:hypothetical protein